MATRFQPLKLENPALFGVRLVGTVGRTDKQLLQELADKCLANGKVELVLDLSQLGSIGGGGAAILADFQGRLAAAGGEAVFVGAGEVVRHFLDQKFGGLPQRHFPDLEAAVDALGGRAPHASPPAGPPDLASLMEKVAEDVGQAGLDLDSVEDLDEIGAVGFAEEDEEDEDDPDTGLDNLLGDYKGLTRRGGRRRDHRYASLTEAIQALGSFSDSQGPREFADALGNLLFSQGLAERVVLLAEKDGLLEDADGALSMAADGPLAEQIREIDRPLTLLDLHDDELDEEETSLLEALNPDMILPVVQDQRLEAVILLQRGGENRDYSVAENFAFELLMRVLAGAQDGPEGPAAAQAAEESEDPQLPELEMPKDQAVTEVLLKLAMDLPEADDRPHFWRIFARHAWSVLPIRDLAYLAPDRSRPQVILGKMDAWMGLDLSNERLQYFFRSIERPVEIRHFPSFFQKTKDELRGAGVTWLVGLKWDDEYLGAILIDGDEDEGDGVLTERIAILFAHTARLFAQFDGNNDDADVHLGLVRILTARREKRCFGSDAMTKSLVEQVNILAKEMGFPPDQKRDLLYGCLLRDIGLVDKPDDLMKPASRMTPDQLEVYHRHPLEGERLLADLNLPSTIVEVVSAHHERFNGLGFPNGLKGRKIPLSARVVSVVEKYVQMITGIGGRRPLKPEDAAKILRENADGRCDPDIVSVFLSAVLPQEEDQPKPARTRDKVRLS